MRLNVPPKRQLPFNGVHGVISQKIELSWTSSSIKTYSEGIIVNGVLAIGV
jgi:hypothetical protein